MYCHNCGKKLEEDEIYCSYCGTKAIKPDISPKEDISHQNDISASTQSKDNNDEVVVESEFIFCADSEKNDSNDIEKKKDEEPISAAEEFLVCGGDTQKEPILDQLNTDTESEQIKEQKQEDLFEPVPDIVFQDNINEKKQRRPRSKGGKAVAVVCSVFLSLLIGILVFSLIIQVFLRMGFTEKKLTEALTNVKYTEVEAKNILDLEDLSEKYNTDIPEDTTLAEAIYYVIDQKELVNPISKAEVVRLVERLNFEEFIAQKAEKAVNIIRSGSDEQIISASEIIDFLKENEETIELTIGIDMLDVDYQYMQKKLEDSDNELFGILFNDEVPEDMSNIGFEITKFLFSDIFMVIICVLIVFISAAIGFINRKFSSALLYTGVPFSAFGLILLLTGTLYKFNLRLNADYIASDFIISLTSPLAQTLSLISAFTLGIGLLMVILGILLSLSRKKSKNVVLTALLNELVLLI